MKVNGREQMKKLTSVVVKLLGGRSLFLAASAELGLFVYYCILLEESLTSTPSCLLESGIPCLPR